MTKDKNGFAMLLGQAMVARQLSAPDLAEEAGVTPQRLEQWLQAQWEAEDAPTTREIARLANALEIPDREVEEWLDLNTLRFSSYKNLLAAVAVPGLSRYCDPWLNSDEPGEGEEDESPSASRIGLENALLVLALQHGARAVLDTAEELYSQTKEGREEKAAQASEASEHRWEQKRQAAASRSGSGQGGKSKAYQDALRELGI